MSGELHEGGIERRAVLRRAAALGGAAVAAAAVLRPEAVSAGSGTMIYGNDGFGNNAGTSYTSLTSTSLDFTLNVLNNASGPGMYAQSSTGTGLIVRQNVGTSTADGMIVTKFGQGGVAVRVFSKGDGAGVAVTRSSPATGGAAIDAIQSAAGPAYRATASASGNAEPLFDGIHNGVGGGIRVALANVDSQATAVEATTDGKGVAVHGTSKKGRGAVFQGKAAQARLVPGSGATHPASGAPGDLYVDSASRLWFCKGGTSWVKLA